MLPSNSAETPEQVLSKALKYIIRAQNADGSFDSVSTIADATKQTPEKFKTCFYTSLILSSLVSISNSKLAEAKNQAATFLLGQKSRLGTFNYWAKDFVKYKEESCPDDLDDTCCALSALTAHGHENVREADLANLTKVLINLEVKEGGPYYTWIIPKENKKWLDIDLAVNANIGFFLSKLGIKLKNLDGLVEKAIRNHKFHSTYYPDYTTIYFVSRFYQGDYKQKLAALVRQENALPFKSSLECALLGLSLLNLGESKKTVERNIRYLLSHQQKDGSYEPGTFILERTFKTGQKRLSGSAALTTALAAELITRYQDAKEVKVKKGPADKYAYLRKRVLKRAILTFSKRFSSDLLSEFSKALDYIASKDYDNQIILHPYLFVNSLGIHPAKKFDKDFLLDLAVGSICGWIAYTIYDNVIDEKKDIDKLMIANVCYRELETLFSKHNPSFRPVAQQFLDRVDYANFFENKNVHIDISQPIKPKKYFPNLEFIAEKSIAHCLGPLAILHHLGYHEDSAQFKNLLNFYQNYLVARQLNDDAHDWEEDLSRGQINYASELLLKDCSKTFPTLPLFAKDRDKMRRVFWEKTIVPVAHLIIEKVETARRSLESLSDIVDNQYLSTKLAELEGAAKKALQERENTVGFINAYYKKK